MGIPNNYTPVEITPFAGQTEFPFPFYLDSVDDFYFFIDGDDTERLAGNYSIAPQYIDNENGGIVVLTNAPYTGTGDAPVVKLLRKSIIERLAQFIINQPVTPAMLNSEFNNIILILQEHAHILDSLDAEAIQAKVIEVAQEAASAVVGEANLTIGDSLVTARNLDSNELYIREKTNFVRADYPDFDALLGVYSPTEKDFTDYTSENILLPKVNTEPPSPFTGSLVDSNNVTFRSQGIFGNLFFTLRSDELSLINKSDMTLNNTITPDVGTKFVTAGVVNSKLLIWVETTGITTTGSIYELDSDLLGITNVKTITGLRSGNFQAFTWQESTFIDTNENYFYLTLNPLAFTTTARKITSVIRILKDYSESSSTTLIHDSSIPTTEINSKAYYPYYDNISNELKIIYTTTSSSSILSPIITSVPDSFLNKINNTNVNSDVPLNLMRRLNSVSPTLLTNGGTGLVMHNNTITPRFIFNENKNELVAVGNFNQLNASVIDPALYVKFNLSTGNAESVLIRSQLEEFLNLNDMTISGSSQHYSVDKSIEVNIGSKTYQPIIWNASSQQGIIFINNDDNIEIIKNRSHNVDIAGSNSYLFCSHEIVSDEKNIIYFTDGNGDNSDSNRTVRKLTMIDDATTSPSRPAPELNAVLPARGYWKGRDV